MVRLTPQGEQENENMIEPITKNTFKGDSNSREHQLREKLEELTIAYNNLLDEYTSHLVDFHNVRITTSAQSGL